MSKQTASAADTIEGSAKTVEDNAAAPAAQAIPAAPAANPYLGAGLMILKTLGVIGVGVLGFKVGQVTTEKKMNKRIDHLVLQNDALLDSMPQQQLTHTSN